jgi:CO/xanthine dehydrogenase FAD-binding subunit
LRKISELRGITAENGVIRIGALMTVTEILLDSTLAQMAGILRDAADCFASDQVRNNATIGGNICNASPAGDLIIPLLVLDAEVELSCWSGDQVATRSLPLCHFFSGPGTTEIQPNEVLRAITFAVPDRDFVARFVKLGSRPALDISVVSVGVAGIQKNDTLQNARVAFGAVAPTPLRGRKTEAVIEGQCFSNNLISAAAEQAAAEVSPISDVRASAWYRQEMIRVLMGRVLRDVLPTAD